MSNYTQQKLHFEGQTSELGAMPPSSLSIPGCTPSGNSPCHRRMPIVSLTTLWILEYHVLPVCLEIMQQMESTKQFKSSSWPTSKAVKWFTVLWSRWWYFVSQRETCHYSNSIQYPDNYLDTGFTWHLNQFHSSHIWQQQEQWWWWPTSTRHSDSKTLLESTVLATVASQRSYFTLFTIWTLLR